MDRPQSRPDVLPIVLHRALDVEYVSAERLPPEVAAQIVRNHGSVEIQINDTVSSRQRGFAARHCVEQHLIGCYTADCPYARALLRDHTPAAADLSSVSA